MTGRNGGKFEIRDGMKNHLRTSPSAAARTPVSHGMFIMQSASMGEQERVRVSQPSIAAGTRIAAPIPTKAGLVKPIRVDKQVKRLRRWKATGANDNANNNSRAMREPRWLSFSWRNALTQRRPPAVRVPLSPVHRPPPPIGHKSQLVSAYLQRVHGSAYACSEASFLLLNAHRPSKRLFRRADSQQFLHDFFGAGESFRIFFGKESLSVQAIFRILGS